LFAVDPDQFAPAKGEPGRRQQQEKFAGLQNIDGALNRELGAGVGNIQQLATSSPRPIDAHQVDGMGVFKLNTGCLSIFSPHQTAPAVVDTFPVTSGLVAERPKSPKRIVCWATERQSFSNFSLAQARSCSES
jgi:hypothetical protein